MHVTYVIYFMNDDVSPFDIDGDIDIHGEYPTLALAQLDLEYVYEMCPQLAHQYAIYKRSEESV